MKNSKISLFEDSPLSRTNYERALGVMPGGNTRTTVYLSPFPLYASRGEGSRIIDVDGVSRLDCINNFTSAIHGHAHPRITKAVAEQLALGTCFGMPTESEIRLAECLIGRVESLDHVRFGNSGTEGVMMALKAARAFTGRAKIAKTEGAYHGSYDYAEVSLDPTPADWDNGGRPTSKAYANGTPQGILDDTIVLPFNDVDRTVQILRDHGENLAGVLIDPMPNRAGLVPAREDYLQAIRSVADEIGALVIFDEVITFRLALGGAQSLGRIQPDLTVLGKIIGGGFPVGAVGGRSEVMTVFDPSQGKPKLPQGGTFSANPITMTAGLAAMELLTARALRHLDTLGDMARRELDEVFKRADVVGCTTGAGSLLKVHFKALAPHDYRSAYPSVRERAMLAAFHQGLLARKIIIADNGLLALSTVMNLTDIDELTTVSAEVLADMRRRF